MQRIILYIALVFFALEELKAQESMNTSGGDANGTGGTVSFSVGQLMYSTASGTNGTVEQGIQQLNIISSVVSGIENSGIQIKSTAYPNPTSTDLKLEVDNLNGFLYQLFDIKGNIIHTQHVRGKSVIIDMKDFPQAIYILNVISSGSLVKKFKIIKD
ncbi:T9SS type A sorting domain-containing protein [Marivirga salinae]|uniref:T9SS type A sorting domain-containing protein n=1 Tax=Marivirga salinarum TaxID=3059078 RepID=A0AA49J911_9BACT|nr:T9SS type A sorting domain-containing protein [Marivirga sp. BDSF4-3]WKK73512.2 T9SS type A sorting domain-containing protein [Marivirga sp. BDSF4-3]